MNARDRTGIREALRLLRAGDALAGCAILEVMAQPKPSATAEYNGGAVWGMWVDEWRRATGRDPVAAGADLRAAKEVARLVSRAQVREVLARYLADGDVFLERQGWPLRLLPGRLNAYLGRASF